MSAHKLHIAGKVVRLHGALVDPDFRTQRVLCSDPWDFVSLWLKRAHKKDALFYWEQSKHFFEASKSLPDLASPLTTYYCLLNATKALLSAKEQIFTENHGVGGRAAPGHKSLSNELVDFQGAGVLPALCNYLVEPTNAGKTFTLQQIFWQIPFIHRAYCLSYRRSTDLFLPLTGHFFLRQDGSSEAWLHAEIDRP